MINPIPKLDTYTYSVSDITFHSPEFTESITILSKYVRTITISKMYEKNIVPLIFISMHIYKDVYEKMTTSIKSLNASLTLYKSKDVATTNDRTNVSYKIPVIQGNFKVYNRDLLDTRVPGQLSNSKDDMGNVTEQTLEFNIYLFDHEKVLNYKKNSSQILLSTANDCVFRMLKERGFKDILMSSTKSYDTKNYIIPYGNLGENLDFMNEYYGIYDTQRILFSDFDITYLLDRESIGTTLHDDELSTVALYMEKREEAASARNGSYVDKDNGYYVMNITPFIVNDTDTMMDFNSAGELTSILSGTDEKYQEKLGDYEIEKAVIVNNEKVHNQTVYAINEEKRSVDVEFSDIDISIITPNKIYRVIPDAAYKLDYDIKLNYRLRYALFSFRQKGEGVMKCAAQCRLMKLGK